MLEEFKNRLPEKIVVYLNEQKVTCLTDAAILADEFLLTHNSVFSPPVCRDPIPIGQSPRSPKIHVVAPMLLLLTLRNGSVSIAMSRVTSSRSVLPFSAQSYCGSDITWGGG